MEIEEYLSGMRSRFKGDYSARYDPGNLSQEGIIDVQRSRITSALQKLKEFPEDYNAHIEYSAALADCSYFELAQEVLAQAVDMKPNDPRAYLALAEINNKLCSQNMRKDKKMALHHNHLSKRILELVDLLSPRDEDSRQSLCLSAIVKPEITDIDMDLFRKSGFRKKKVS